MNKIKDFTSALYLGLKHAQEELPSWTQLTTGKPAVLFEPKSFLDVASGIAKLQRQEAGVFLPSTLHGFQDIFDIFPGRQIAIFQDELLYPAGQNGSRTAKLKGIQVYSFRHLDANAAHLLAAERLKPGQSIVIFTDGWCPRCGRPAPIKEYLQLVEKYQGWVIVDDTQALGLLGAWPSPKLPYGYGGGGTIPWLDICSDRLILISSLAKGFGVPAAVISGSSKWIQHFANANKTRIYHSPPSITAALAAGNALKINREKGDRLRWMLFRKVHYFKHGLRRKGIFTSGWYFPVQTLRTDPGTAIKLHLSLQKAGIQTVLSAIHDNNLPEVSFLLRTDMEKKALDHTINICNKLLVRSHFQKSKNERYEKFK